MIKKIIRSVVAWANEDDNFSKFEVRSRNSDIASVNYNTENFPNGLNFTVHSANGGKVIRVYYYNQVTDKSSNELYIIRNDDDLGTEISRILTIENLKK